MASKVFIRIPVPFNNQIGKKNPDVIAMEPFTLPSMSSDPVMRVSQLEQNIRFLQDQHQILLSSLHKEIEALRQRNRDLQFQLIFGKSSLPHPMSSSDSSPDKATTPKPLLSPNEVNHRSLKVEMLEKEIQELKATVAEANNKNQNLVQQLEQQKKKFDILKKESLDRDHYTRLEEAEKLIKHLIRENEEQQKELSTLRSHLVKAGNNGHYSGGNHKRGNSGGHNRFPPLPTQSFWSQTPQHRISPEYRRPSEGGGLKTEVVGQAAPTLPHLSRTYSQPLSHNRPRYYSNGNHFYRGHSGEEGSSDGRSKHRGRGRGSSYYKPPPENH